MRIPENGEKSVWKIFSERLTLLTLDSSRVKKRKLDDATGDVIMGIDD